MRLDCQTRPYIHRSGVRLTATRGFTLIELVVTVAIVGILATIGVSLIRRHTNASKSGEAFAMVQAIRGAQERWRAQTQAYSDVSTTLTTWYPSSGTGERRIRWGVDGTDKVRWDALAPQGPTYVQFGYVTKAGLAGSALPVSIDSAQVARAEPWYVIQARADIDGDGVAAMFTATSLTGEVQSVNVGE